MQKSKNTTYKWGKTRNGARPVANKKPARCAGCGNIGPISIQNKTITRLKSINSSA